MTTYHSSFFYLLDQNGASTNGKTVSQVPNGEANSTESVDDNTITVGETFTVVFTDPTTNSTYGGVYTYGGYETDGSGIIGKASDGNFYLFSSVDGIPDHTNLNSFSARDITVCFLAGTMILCPEGERAVEALRVGDLVLTCDGRVVQSGGSGGRPYRRRSACRTAGARSQSQRVPSAKTCLPASYGSPATMRCWSTTCSYRPARL